MHSGGLRRLRRRGLPRRLRDLKCIRFPRPVRRTCQLTSSRHMKSIHVPQGVRPLRLVRNTPERSGPIRRIIRTNMGISYAPLPPLRRVD
jgi:hypothetical protein